MSLTRHRVSFTFDERIMKKIQAILIMTLLLLQVGCVTTKSFTYERQQQYQKVLVISSIGEKITANKTKNYLLAIKNEVYREPLGENSFVEEIEDFVQRELSDKVPFGIVTMHDFYPRNATESNQIFVSLMSYKKTGDLLRKNNFDAVILIRGNRTLHGHPYDGIDKIYDEVGLYKEGEKSWFFTHFNLSFITPEGDYEFSEYELERIPYTLSELDWESQNAPWKNEDFMRIVEAAASLTKDRLAIAIQEGFFPPPNQ